MNKLNILPVVLSFGVIIGFNTTFSTINADSKALTEKTVIPTTKTIDKDDIKASKDISFDGKTQDSLESTKKESASSNNKEKVENVSNTENKNDKETMVGNSSSSSSTESTISTSSESSNSESSSSSVISTNTVEINTSVSAVASTSTSISKEDVSAAFEKIAKEFNLSDTDQEKWKFIIQKESGFNTSATNAASGAYGLGQALPGNKMAVYGSDWQTNPEVQLRWMYNYMNERYGSINNAYNYWLSHKWY